MDGGRWWRERVNNAHSPQRAELGRRKSQACYGRFNEKKSTSIRSILNSNISTSNSKRLDLESIDQLNCSRSIELIRYRRNTKSM